MDGLSEDKKNIVVLGGGFGGLRAALTLSRRLKTGGFLDRYQVVLVDRNEYHTYTPLLPHLAVPAEHPAKEISEVRAARPFADILHGKPIKFIRGEAAELDLVRGDIHLARGEELNCAYLILAPGSETNYFGIPGLKENSLPLRTFIDAKNIWTALTEAFENKPDPRIIVGGGGPTGIELAANIKHDYPRALVSIVEAMPTLLPGFSPRILKPAEKRLRKMGVELVLNEPVAEAGPESIKTKNGRELPYDLLIWTGGVKAPDFLAGLPIKTEPRGRVEVKMNMFCLPHTPDLKLGPMIYALGDSVCIYDPETGKPLPGVAHTAIEQGEVAAHNILEDIRKAEGVHQKHQHTAYKPKGNPYVLTVGGKWAVAKIGPVVFTGWLAWLFARVIEWRYRLSL